MQLVHLITGGKQRWALDDRLLPLSFRLDLLLQLPRVAQADFLRKIVTGEPAAGGLLAPIEADQEVWASGVTFLRSRDARQAESTSSSVYERVYDAERPELFFKALGWRVIDPESAIRVRKDSAWNVPEPELTLVLNSAGEICGYTAGNDISSRDIEGENPLYLPQAKVYNGSCALGSHISLLGNSDEVARLPIHLTVWRDGKILLQEQTNTEMMKRGFEELAVYLFRELSFPYGVFLMTGTGIVPPDTFTLRHGDDVLITVGNINLRNRVIS